MPSPSDRAFTLQDIATLLVTYHEPGLLGCAAFSELSPLDEAPAVSGRP